MFKKYDGENSQTYESFNNQAWTIKDVEEQKSLVKFELVRQIHSGRHGDIFYVFTNGGKTSYYDPDKQKVQIQEKFQRGYYVLKCITFNLQLLDLRTNVEEKKLVSSTNMEKDVKKQKQGKSALGQDSSDMKTAVKNSASREAKNLEIIQEHYYSNQSKQKEKQKFVDKQYYKHIIKFRSYLSQKQKQEIFILFPYYANQDLAQFRQKIIKNGFNFSADQITYIGVSLLKGLIVLHNFYMVHRAIQLSNILIDHQGNIMIADFGSSNKAQNQEKRKTKVFGLLEYMAPEMEYNIGKTKDDEDVKKYSIEVDIYSLGCLLYFLLFKRFPRQDKDPFKNLSQTVEKQKDSYMKKVVQILTKLIADMLVKSQQKRPSATQLLQNYQEMIKNKNIELNFAKIQKQILKKRSIQKIIVRKVYHIKKIGFFFMLSNGKLYIFSYKRNRLLFITKTVEKFLICYDKLQCKNKQQSSSFQQEVKKGIEINFNSCSDTIERQNYKYFYVFLSKYPSILTELIKLRQEQDFFWNMKNQSTIISLQTPEDHILFIKLNNGVLQCFFADKPTEKSTQILFRSCFIFNSFIGVKNQHKIIVSTQEVQNYTKVYQSSKELLKIKKLAKFYLYIKEQVQQLAKKNKIE